MSAAIPLFPHNAHALSDSGKLNLFEYRSFDEIDNKTHDTTYSVSYVMTDPYKSEEERLKSFERWPLDFIDKRVLAQTGMIYTGDGDKVKCYFCDVEIGRWEPIDHPVQEHMKWSPNCPLLRRRTVNNIPINMEALDRVLPPLSYDVCGSISEPTETRPTAIAEDSISPSLSSRSAFYQMEYPAYAVEAARFRSFADWPRTMKQRPKDLAEAGFFYTGNGDRVNCFSCGGGLKDWDENDDPWEQHALWLKKCRYLKLMKGQDYIDAVIAKHKLAAEKREEASTTTTESQSHDTVVGCCETSTIGENKTTIGSTHTTETASTVAAAPTATSTATATSTIGRDFIQRSNSSSSTERGNIPEEKLCKICYAAEYNTTFLPCGHVVACARCASSVNRFPCVENHSWM